MNPVTVPLHILLVEDDCRIAAHTVAGLASHGHQVDHVQDGHRALERALAIPYDAIVLDVMLPGRDGLSVLRSVREHGPPVSILLLTARNELDDRLAGLQLGADDYLAKPFYVEELAARLQAMHRRAHGDRRHSVRVGPLSIDLLQRSAAWGAIPLSLTAREFCLLEFMLRTPGVVIGRQQILEHVWGYDFDTGTNVVDVCIGRVRTKLADAGAEANRVLKSVRGSGYVLHLV